MSAPVMGGLEINKFEQVFSEGHQMSLVGGSLYSEVSCLEGVGPRLGVLASDIQCIIGNGHMGLLPALNRMTDRHL